MKPSNNMRKPGISAAANGKIGTGFHGISNQRPAASARRLNPAHLRQTAKILTALLLANLMASTFGFGPAGLSIAYAEGSGSGLYGVIELGNAGIRAQICEGPSSDTDTNKVKTIFAFDPREVRPSESNAVANTIRVVRELIGTMIRERNVPSEHIYILGSSGLAEASTSSTLRKEVSATLGRTLTYVSVQDEARLTLKGLVPRDQLSTVVLIDVGSGNSKAVYYKLVDGKPFVDTVRLCDGVRALGKKADQTKPEAQYLQELLALKDKEITSGITQVVLDNPAFATRPLLYLSGGICWVMASSLSPPNARTGEGDDEVELKAADIAAWLTKVQATPRAAYEYPVDKVKPECAQIPKDNRASVEANFGPAQITSGVVILQALQDSLGFSGRQRIIFRRDSLFAWPRAYLADELSKKHK